MRKIPFIAVIGLVALIAAGCGRKQQKESVRGTVENGVYRNGFFGFTMEIPGGMYVMPRAEIDSLEAVMGSMVGLGGGDTADLLLFVSAKDPSAADSLFNYNITVTSEKVSGAKEVNSNERYMSQVIKTLQRGAASEGGEMPVGRATFGGREFMKLTLGQYGVTQDIYARLHDGYALLIIGSYDGPEQRDAIARVLATIAFEKE